MGAVARPRTDRTKRAEQAETAYRLRLAGLPLAVIAKKLGVSQGTVSNRLAEAAATRTDPLVDQWRQVESDRLDDLLFRLQPGIMEGSPQHIATAVRLSERRSKLLGLDAPQQMAVALAQRTELEADAVAEAVGAAVDFLADALAPDDPRLTGWAADVRSAALTVAQWALLGRDGEQPAAPPRPVLPDLLGTVTVDRPPAWMRASSREEALKALESEVGKFEDRWGPL